MNRHLTNKEYDSLVDRQTMKQLPVVGQFYRDSYYPMNVFECQHASSAYVAWSAFGLTIMGVDR